MDFMLLRDRVIDLVKKCGVPLIAKGGQNPKDYFGNLQDHTASELMKLHFEDEAVILCMNLFIHKDVTVEMTADGFFYLGYFQKVSGSRTYDGCSMPLLQDVLYTNAATEHPVLTSFRRDTRLIGFVIFLSAEAYVRHISAKFSKSVSSPTVLTSLNGCRHMPELVKILRQLLDYGGEGPFAELYYTAKIQEILTFVLGRAFENGNYCSLTDGILSDDAAISKVQVYITSHLEDNISNARLALLACMSQAKLKYTFRRITGMTITEYKNTVRLDRAKSMLIKTDLPIADISAACGFNSASAFTAFFKKHTGMTPTKLRS